MCYKLYMPHHLDYRSDGYVCALLLVERALTHSVRSMLYSLVVRSTYETDVITRNNPLFSSIATDVAADYNNILNICVVNYDSV